MLPFFFFFFSKAPKGDWKQRLGELYSDVAESSNIKEFRRGHGKVIVLFFVRRIFGKHV